jgi:hypothetical protein
VERESGQVRQQTNATFNNSTKKKNLKEEKKRKEEAERKQRPKLHDGCFWLARWLLGHESRLTYIRGGTTHHPSTPDFFFTFVFLFIWMQVSSLEKEDTPHSFSSRVFLHYYKFYFFLFYTHYLVYSFL